MTVDDAEVALKLQQAVKSIKRGTDLQTLRCAMREAVSVSPDAFLSTAADIDAKSAAYWRSELQSSVWVVMQGENEILGIGAAKRRGETEACFVESVWIAPSMRGHRLGERLVGYLIDAKRLEDRIREVFLWVFDKNDSAIELYKRMKFEPTGEQQELQSVRGASIKEIKYWLKFSSTEIKCIDLVRSAEARDQDSRDYGVSYRLLGARGRRIEAQMDEVVLGEIQSVAGW
jgi:ribosomal protein S18 acetylase RimI-like enzyme